MRKGESISKDTAYEEAWCYEASMKTVCGEQGLEISKLLRNENDGEWLRVQFSGRECIHSILRTWVPYPAPEKEKRLIVRYAGDS